MAGGSQPLLTLPRVAAICPANQPHSLRWWARTGGKWASVGDTMEAAALLSRPLSSVCQSMKRGRGFSQNSLSGAEALCLQDV